jgi:hypothetical protein
MACGFVVFRKRPLPRGYVYDEPAGRGEVKENSLNEWVLVRNVFQYVKKKDEIESFAQRLRLLKNIVATDTALLAHVLLESILVQIETSDLPLVGVLYLFLEEAVAATNLGEFARATDEVV